MANSKRAAQKRVSRRAKGDGCVSERPDGTWQYSLRLGSGLRRYVYAATRADLMRRLQDERAKGRGTLHPSTKATVGEAVEAFLADRKPTEAADEFDAGKRKRTNQERAHIAPSTYEGWERAWRHVKPFVQSQRMSEFDYDRVASVRTALLRKGLGVRTIQLIWQVMKLSFDEAIKRKKFFGENPWRLHRPPVAESRETRILKDEEIPRFIAGAVKDRYEALWLLALLAGLRLGEGLGLTREAARKAISHKNGALKVEQQLGEVNGVAKVRRLKTAESNRTVYCDSRLIDALRRRLDAAEKESHDSPYLFTTSTGAFISRTNLRSRNFAAVLKLAEVAKDQTIHGLRHTWAVASVDAGVDVTIVASLGGWASAKMVTEIYAKHRKERLLIEGAQKIHAALTNPGAKKDEAA